MQVERVDFVSVLTQDLQRAKRFYTETLGLEVETEGEHEFLRVRLAYAGSD